MKIPEGKSLLWFLDGLGYAAALHDASSSAGVAAEDIIRLWKEGVPQEYATLAMP